MIFNKPLSEITFEDIEKLKNNRINESDILDYKLELLEDSKLIKHVSSFANTRGGTIVFGVEESGHGGYPVDIPGIDITNINKERLEQIMLSRINPRLATKIHQVPHTDQAKAFLIIQIPDSYLKPHMDNTSGKFYKRYNFEACEMTELEVSEAYKKRFHTYEEVEHYITSILSHHITGNMPTKIIIIPTILNNNLINTFNHGDFTWLDSNVIRPKPPRNLPYLPGPLNPFYAGIVCEQHRNALPSLEIHRNGTIVYIRDFGTINERKYLAYELLADCLLQTLQFAAKDIYSRYNYFGNVKVIITINQCNNSYLPSREGSILENAYGEPAIFLDNNISVRREVSTISLEQDFSYIAYSIMNEIFNHYGIWRCSLFNERSNYIDIDAVRY